MTYNFDPDKWYENEFAALERQYLAGKLAPREYRERLQDLARRHDEMVDRLDGTYRLPESSGGE